MRTISFLQPITKVSASYFKSSFHGLSSLTSPNISTKLIGAESYVKLVEACLLDQNLLLGKVIHSKIVLNGLEKDSFLATKLIGLYSLCKELSLAEAVFNRASISNVFLMNAMIRGYSTNGSYHQALDFFYQKTEGGLKPDSYTFSCVLKVCGALLDLQQGKNLHSLVLQNGLGSDLFVSNALIAMYAKCGSLSNGLLVFERIPKRDIVSWNSIISACVQNGFEQEAMVKVCELVRSGLRPDCVTIASSLSLPFWSLNVREMHGFVVRNGYESTTMVCNSLISAYGKCGRIKEARLVFDNLIRPDKVSWNSMICSYAQNDFFDESVHLVWEMKLAGFDADVVTYSGIISSLSQNGHSHEAMEVFEELLASGLKPDIISIASILPAISDLGYHHCCKEIHAYSYRKGLEVDRRVRNALISVYGKCGSIQNAAHVFDKIRNRDVISWSSMVVGYSKNGYFNEAVKLFRQMLRAKSEPNPITVTSVLSACAGTSSTKQGKEIHLWALKNGFEGQIFVGSALIDMYAKCGRIDEAQKVFKLMKEKNLVSWNSMIGAYAVHGLGEKALEIFRQVEEPDHVSFTLALSACSHGGLVDEGMEIFNSMKSFEVNPQEGHYSCMVDILGRSGRLEQALDLIKRMPRGASADTWGALLGACKIHSSLEIGTYAGSRIVELGCEDPGYLVLFSNLLADFGRWEDAETMRELMQNKGMRKGAGLSWIEVNKEVHSFVARERAQHPEWESLFMLLKGMNEHMKEIRHC